MKCKNRVHQQPNRRRNQRGAALVFALVAVIVISILTLATGRLIGGHLALEQQAEGYSRAINIAEAAANWQLNRMSRSKLPGDNSSIPGRLSSDFIDTWNDGANRQEPFDGELPFDDLGTSFAGRAMVWVRSAAGGSTDGTGKWTPTEDAIIYAIGQDPMTGIRRGVKFKAEPVGISDQYALFGQSELHFDSAPTEAGADAGAARLLRGYIGSNTRVSSREGTPLPIGGTEYFGCRLGPNASLVPTGVSWAAGWDFPRLSNPVCFPTIEQMIGFMYRGRTVADCANPSMNDNAQVEVMSSDTGAFSPLMEAGNPITELTSTQFDRAVLYRGQYRVIRLRANETALNGNLFRFARIQMRPNDVLLLDLRQTKPTLPGVLQHTIRILVDNNSTDDTVITNLAYFNSFLPSQTAGNDNPPTQSYFWYNNTQGTFKFQPSHAEDVRFYEPTPVNPLFRYELRPEMRGIIYGINSGSTLGNSAGDIKVYGKSGFGVKVQSIVGNHVTLLGPVQVQWVSFESHRNPSMYIMYYSIDKRILGELSPDVDPFSLTDGGHQASRPYDYGR